MTYFPLREKIATNQLQKNKTTKTTRIPHLLQSISEKYCTQNFFKELFLSGQICLVWFYDWGEPAVS